MLSVADNGAELHFYINAVSIYVVADPLRPAGDAGLVFGTRSQSQGQALFDWVALYEISVAEEKQRKRRTGGLHPFNSVKLRSLVGCGAPQVRGISVPRTSNARTGASATDDFSS